MSEAERLKNENQQLKNYIAELEYRVCNPDLIDVLAGVAGNSAPQGCGFVERQDKARLMVPHAFANTAMAVWDSACERDGVAPSSAFVVFSPQNEMTQFSGPSQKEFIESVQSGLALGYVALEFQNGRAVDAKPLKRPRVIKRKKSKVSP